MCRKYSLFTLKLNDDFTVKLNDDHYKESKYPAYTAICILKLNACLLNSTIEKVNSINFKGKFLDSVICAYPSNMWKI